MTRTDGTSDPVVDPQPMPTEGKDAVVDFINGTMAAPIPMEVYFFLSDIKRRLDAGEKKYSSKLMSFNGRDATLDKYQELCDAVAYAFQEILEEEGFREGIQLSLGLQPLIAYALECRAKLVERGVLQ